MNGTDGPEDVTDEFALSEPARRADFRTITGPHQPKSRTDVWLTPPWLLAKLGEFDLDPCAASEPRPWPTAKRHIALPENGLNADWGGRVWCNPPYGRQTGVWLQRLAEHGNGIALVFARTDTEMFQEQVFARADGILFLAGRLTFVTPSGKPAYFNAGGPSCLAAYGAENYAALDRAGIPGRLVRL